MCQHFRIYIIAPETCFVANRFRRRRELRCPLQHRFCCLVRSLFELLNVYDFSESQGSTASIDPENRVQEKHARDGPCKDRSAQRRVSEPTTPLGARTHYHWDSPVAVARWYSQPAHRPTRSYVIFCVAVAFAWDLNRNRRELSSRNHVRCHEGLAKSSHRKKMLRVT